MKNKKVITWDFENHYVKIPDDFIDHLDEYTPAEIIHMLLVFRETSGNHKPNFKMSYMEMQNAIPLTKKTIRKAVRANINRGFVRSINGKRKITTNWRIEFINDHIGKKIMSSDMFTKDGKATGGKIPPDNKDGKTTGGKIPPDKGKNSPTVEDIGLIDSTITPNRYKQGGDFWKTADKKYHPYFESIINFITFVLTPDDIKNWIIDFDLFITNGWSPEKVNKAAISHFGKKDSNGFSRPYKSLRYLLIKNEKPQQVKKDINQDPHNKRLEEYNKKNKGVTK